MNVIYTKCGVAEGRTSYLAWWIENEKWGAESVVKGNNAVRCQGATSDSF